MAGASDIRAGKAFVEVYLDKTKLARGLKTVSGDLKAFGAGIASLGKKFMLLGAGITAPMLAAAHVFGSAGAELVDLSAMTGMSTNALSELGFAANLSGASLADLARATRFMQKAITAATDGPLKQLQGMAPEEQFMAVADAMNQIEDPTKRAAKALEVFGRGGTIVLPMIAHVRELRAEAVRLGRSIGPEQAAAAKALDDAWQKTKATFKGVSMAIGGALAPMLTGLSERIATGAADVRKWVSEHKPLITQLFMAGIAATAAGLGLVILGKAVAFAGGVLSFFLAVGKVAVATLVFLKAAILLLANPFVLVTAAIAAFGAYLLTTTGKAGEAATFISRTFATILGEVTSTMGVIAESLAAGDFVSATKVCWAFIKLEWKKGCAFINGLWDTFRDFYDDAIFAMALGWIKGCASIRTVWATLMNWMSKKWIEFSSSGFTEGLADIIVWATADLMGRNREEIRKFIKEDAARMRAGNVQRFEEIDDETRATKQQIQDDRAAQIAILGADVAARDAKREADKTVGQADVDAAQAEWEKAKKDALDKARAPAGEGHEFNFKGALADEGHEFNFKGALADIDLEAAKGPKASVRGTFSASAVAGLGVGGYQDRIAKAVEAMRELERKLLIEQKRLTLEGAP